MRAKSATILAGFLAVTLACNSPAGQERPAPSAASAPAPATAPSPYDPALTDTARVLAGMLPADTVRFAGVTSRQVWKDYRTKIDAEWSADDKGRFAAMSTWRDKELAGQVSGCRTLLYPFAGPDILNAYQLFPTCETYVLFGLELLGTVPHVDRMPAERVDHLVTDVRDAMADLFTRHYFITKNMMTDLREDDLNGVTPVLVLLLARLEARIVSVDRVALTADGPVPPPDPATVSKDSPPLLASRVVFLRKDRDRPQTVIYVKMQAENAGLARRPAAEAYLRRLAPATTMLKAASYLLHTREFSTMRAIVLDTSSSILQDDAGVPFRYLNTPEWRVTLYGRYAPPIKDFTYGVQKDLEAAYAAATPAALPFPYGYHWRRGDWGVMLAVRATPKG
jgi:hypothetical protein